MSSRIKYEKPEGVSLGEVAPIRGATPCPNFGTLPDVTPTCTSPGSNASTLCGPGSSNTSGTCATGTTAMGGFCQPGGSAFYCTGGSFPTYS